MSQFPHMLELDISMDILNQRWYITVNRSPYLIHICLVFSFTLVFLSRTPSLTPRSTGDSCLLRLSFAVTVSPTSLGFGGQLWEVLARYLVGDPSVGRSLMYSSWADWGDGFGRKAAEVKYHARHALPRVRALSATVEFALITRPTRRPSAFSAVSYASSRFPLRPPEGRHCTPPTQGGEFAPPPQGQSININYLEFFHKGNLSILP